ncbi:DNA internalization-related competence protein ComEC/Rec2 [Acinetobacter ihumii]|uniref:DNA internalization-related competence protein ComEC/Rec2 n=1 Tax=Acinetobacter ihumii TaxID=2483802 RepID=UPI00102F6C1B|nr:DNA internalization-related competence protein ComEC/Rec2 [Acinetobacter ihumii]
MLKIILLGWIVGIAFMGQALPIWHSLAYVFLPVSLLLWAIYFYQANTVQKHRGFKILLIVSSIFAMFCLGKSYADQALLERLNHRELTARTTSEIIYIRKIGEKTEKGIKQPAEVLSNSKHHVTWLIYVNDALLENLAKQSDSLFPGHYYQITGWVKPVHGYANAGGFDQEKWFIQQNWMSSFQVQHIQELSQAEVSGLGYQAHLKQQDQLWQRFRLYVEQLRLNYRSTLQQQPVQYKALMLALLTGDRSLLDRPTEQLFQRFGIAHLLAISGPHVLILAGMMTWLITFMIHRIKPELYLKYPRKILIVLPFISFVLLYTAFVGFEIPALRTLLFVLISSLFLLFKSEIRPFSILILSASLNLLLDPFSVLSAAFWLSYGACFILFNIYQAITSTVPHHGLSFRQKAWRSCRILIESQWKIFVALFPLVLIFFKQVTWMAPFANLLVIPFLGAVIIPLNILAALMQLLLPSLGSLLFQLNDLLIRILFMLLNAIDQLFNPQLHAFALTPFILFSFTLGITLLFLPRNVLPKTWALLCISPIFLVVWAKRDIQLSVIDVGQGQAVFVQDAKQRTLIDTGGFYDESKFSIGQQVLLPYLRQQGVTELDRIILSHLDQDHSGALDSVLQAMPVKNLMANETLTNQTIDTHLNSSVSKCHAGQTWQTQDVKMTVLSPAWMDDQLITLNRNEHSCVIYIEFLSAKNLRHFLIMGDAGWQTEFQLLQNHPELKVDVLVLGHHGSQHSSSYDFLKHYQPKLAVASVGYANRYGHPSIQTQARLKALNIPLETTIQSGTLNFVLKDHELKLDTYREHFKWLDWPDQL